IPLSKLDTHPMVGLHVPTMRPISSFHECLNRYIFMWSKTYGKNSQVSAANRAEKRITGRWRGFARLQQARN
ncbi:MAG: hypothetical protein ABSD64_09955, partial [Terriglobales bacterium]